MKLATLLSIIGVPAVACDLDGSYADATRTTTGAEVYLQNNLARARYAAVQCIFSMGDGLAIQVIWTHGPGDAPDTAEIFAPPGFLAIPPEATIPEGGAQRVLIVPEVS